MAPSRREVALQPVDARNHPGSLSALTLPRFKESDKAPRCSALSSQGLTPALARFLVQRLAHSYSGVHRFAVADLNVIVFAVPA